MIKHFPHIRKEGQDTGAVIRDGDWKLIWDFETDATFLYNLKEDLGEANDLAAEYPDQIEALLTKLKNWQS